MASGSRYSFAHLYLWSVSASVASIATPLGCLLCGPLLDQFGRRIALMALNVPFALGWLTLALTPSPVYTPLLYMGRILTGIGTSKPVSCLCKIHRPAGICTSVVPPHGLDEVREECMAEIATLILPSEQAATKGDNFYNKV